MQQIPQNLLQQVFNARTASKHFYGCLLVDLASKLVSLGFKFDSQMNPIACRRHSNDEDVIRTLTNFYGTQRIIHELSAAIDKSPDKYVMIDDVCY